MNRGFPFRTFRDSLFRKGGSRHACTAVTRYSPSVPTPDRAGDERAGGWAPLADLGGERRKTCIRCARDEWMKHRLPWMCEVPGQLVFIDETAVKTNLTRLRGRAPKGGRLPGAVPFGAWETQTFIAGLTANGLIAPWVVDHAMNGKTFATYIRPQLAPVLAPRTLEAAEAWRERGGWFLFLPPYSPDLNPIEMAFAKLKAHLRRMGARTFDQLIAAIGEICDLFTPDECWNDIAAAGYASK